MLFKIMIKFKQDAHVKNFIKPFLQKTKQKKKKKVLCYG